MCGHWLWIKPKIRNNKEGVYQQSRRGRVWRHPSAPKRDQSFACKIDLTVFDDRYKKDETKIGKIIFGILLFLQTRFLWERVI